MTAKIFVRCHVKLVSWLLEQLIRKNKAHKNFVLTGISKIHKIINFLCRYKFPAIWCQDCNNVM